MSGNKNLNSGTQTIDNRYKIIEDWLNQYEKKNGLPDLVTNATSEEVGGYLSMDAELLSKLSVDECNNIQYRLSSLSLHVQRLINKEKSRLAWANHVLDDFVSKHIASYSDKYAKHDMKVRWIANENQAVERLLSIIKYANIRVESLSFIPQSLNQLADRLEGIKRAKLYQTAE